MTTHFSLGLAFGVMIVLSGVAAGQTPASALIDPPLGHRCPECGVVESSRVIVRYPEGMGRNATLPMVPVARNDRADWAFRVSEVTVRMRDGTSRRFDDTDPPKWRPGERMIVIDGVSLNNR